MAKTPYMPRNADGINTMLIAFDGHATTVCEKILAIDIQPNDSSTIQ